MNLSVKNKNSYKYIIFYSIGNMWPIWLSFWFGVDLNDINLIINGFISVGYLILIVILKNK